MKSILLILISVVVSHAFYSQKKTLTIEDAELAYYKGLYPENLQNLQWLKNSNWYSYHEDNALRIKSAQAGSRTPEYSITLDLLAAANIKMDRFPYVTWSSASEFYFFREHEMFSYDYLLQRGKKLLQLPKEAANKDYQSEKNLMAYTKDENLYIADRKQNNIPVFETDDQNIVTGQAIHRYEFGISKGTFWSPSGSCLAFYQKDEIDVANYPLLDVTTTPGSLHSIKYPMAGQKSERGRVGLFHVATRKNIFLETGKPLDHYLTNLVWSPDEKYIFLAEVNRDQNHMWFNQYDAFTGKKITTLFEEEREEWVEPEHPAYFIPGSNEQFLWISERDGFNNLYLYSLSEGLIKQVTKFNWPIKSILGFANKGKTVLVEGPGEDPKNNQAFSINIKTGKIIQLTNYPGIHNLQISSDGVFLLDNGSSNIYNGLIPDPRDDLKFTKGKPTKGPFYRSINVLNTKNGQSSNIFKAENPLKNYAIGNTNMVELKSKDGFDLYGRMIRPEPFDPSKKYPVIVYVYGGPHAQLVTNDWLGGARLWMHAMAQKGYIVFTLDGRGSANRGYDFEKVIHRQLGTKEIEDQMVGVDYLKSLSYVDVDRMAIHGWSFGGFMTTSIMLKHPDVFKVGVAGGPVIDWKWYEIMYGERYMDTPEQNPEGYKNASLLNYAKNLKGKLLLIHGTVDDVVVPQHSLGFIQQCVTDGVQLDFFPYPNHQHNVRGKDRVHLMTKVLGYIEDNL